ncbi:C40 family peptidase [Treponema pectinovorum]|uniref:C40 family peptidase n=1 Tax=Treponema pectinovorum TaxID=164 RepID=UPI0011F14751|nr:C40 family peptidase [Treponema pectinovorum]
MTRIERNHLFVWLCFVFLILFTPRLCAQNALEKSAEALKTRQTFAEYGKKYVGSPYVSGATGPASFDCSGYVYAVARESIGWQLPRTVTNIYRYCKIIDDSQREIGDLVFFKTTESAEPSHVGIYIGNNQFLNAASDGPNTGVILSSLNEGYWRGKYFKTGRFLPPSKVLENEELKNAEGDESSSVKSSEKNGEIVIASNKSRQNSSGKKNSIKGADFLQKVSLDANLSMDWNFFTPEYFRLNLRGINLGVNALYDSHELKPGIGTIVRWDGGTGILQLPIIFSLTVKDYVRIFAGPVFTIGNPKLQGSDGEDIKASVFPGILGICFNTPPIKTGKFDLCFTQDIHYTIFNETNGAALSPIKSLATGLVFSSGIRVTLPFSSLL